MSFLKKSMGLFVLFAVIPTAYAVTARPSVTAATATASRRLPTLTAYINKTTTSNDITTGGTGGDTSTGTMSDLECVEAYTECMRADDACGLDFEECTNKKLFHGQMPKCLSVLAQCSTGGIYDLFGTSSIDELGDGVTSDSIDGSDYEYPASGSVMNQWISAAAINNQYDTATCVKRYTSCLQKDSVCGADFELCTSDREFKKQALLCDSTLARCQKAGVIELLGKYPWSPSKAGETIGGRVKSMIEDGANLAAMNAVSTCYRVVEQCFLGACTANPLRCIEGADLSLILAGDAASESMDELQQTPLRDRDNDGKNGKTEINSYLKSICLDTIGANKYCHMTFREKTPSKGDLQDVDMQEEVFAEAVAQRKQYVESKITGLMQDFDKRTKDKCVNTIRTCAMRTCGEGVGSVCYTSVFGEKGQDTINGSNTYNEIKTGCEAIVNSDKNCQYTYTSVQQDNYSYSYVSPSVFDTLFPSYNETDNSDPIGVIASLNASLAQNYNAAAIADMKKQCQTVARNCVKSLCGTDYVNCYRNRTDITSDLTKTNSTSFNNSMNKVGGVLDYTIVLGLCMDTVKNANACDEHLKITAARFNTNAAKNPWGTDSVRNDWVDAGGSKEVTENKIQDVDENGEPLCTNADGTQCPCNDFVNEKICNTPVYTTQVEYNTKQAATTLFKELITDIEYEAQAIYNAKLTKQQNMCLSLNQGGVLGTQDQGSTYAWVKLKKNSIPKYYSTAGLKPSDFTNSNDLYGSFCRVRVTLQSDDPAIQELLNKGSDWATAYFAAGDAYTCGSWIGESNLRKLAEAAGTAAREKKNFEIQKDGTNNWYWALPAIMTATGIGGAYLAENYETGDIFGGLTGKTGKKAYKDQCLENIEEAEKNLTEKNWASAVAYIDNALSYANQAGVETDDYEHLNDIETEVTPAHTSSGNANTIYMCGTQIVSSTDRCVGNMTLTAAKNKIETSLSTLEGQCNGNTDNQKACKTLISTARSSLDKNNLKEAQTNFNDARAKAIADNVQSPEKWPNDVGTEITDPTSPSNTSALYYCGNDHSNSVKANTKCVGDKTLKDATKAIKGQLTALKIKCEAATSEGSTDREKNGQWGAGVVSSLIGGGLTIGVIETAKDTMRDQAELDAYNAFYNELGQHIHCYVGGEPAGEFGQTVFTSME